MTQKEQILIKLTFFISDIRADFVCTSIEDVLEQYCDEIFSIVSRPNAAEDTKVLLERLRHVEKDNSQLRDLLKKREDEICHLHEELEKLKAERLEECRTLKK